MWLFNVLLQTVNQNINIMCLEAGPRLCTGAGGMDVWGVPGDRRRLLALQLSNTNAICVKLVESAPSGGERVGLRHPQKYPQKYHSVALSCKHTFPLSGALKKEKCKVCILGEIQPGAAVVNVNHNWTSSHSGKVTEDGGEFLIFTDCWQWYSGRPFHSREKLGAD